MTTSNPITGDLLKTKPASQAYLDNYDAIFGKKNIKQESENNQKDSQNGSTDNGESGRTAK